MLAKPHSLPRHGGLDRRAGARADSRSGGVWDVGWIDGFTRGGGSDVARLFPAGAVAKDVGKGVEGEWLVGREGRGGGEEERRE